jgi:hypothetical protein
MEGLALQPAVHRGEESVDQLEAVGGEHDLHASLDGPSDHPRDFTDGCWVQM